MAISENKTRIQITLGNDVLAMLDDYCEKTGMSRSAYIAFVISQQLYNTNRVFDITEKAIQEGLAEVLA